LSALQLLAIFDSLDDDSLNREAVISFISSLQLNDGSFAGDEWGEVDTRFTYCTLSSLSLLHALPRKEDKVLSDGVIFIDVPKAAEYIALCANFDGGFGCVPGAESHAGQVFTCVASLSLAQSLHLLDHDLLSWWLAKRQCDSGGFNGRPEKQADVCYSWWILSSISIMGRMHYIDTIKLANFVLKCQDDDDGGIADRPGNMPDVFHTFFGVAGLSLVGYLHQEENTKPSISSTITKDTETHSNDYAGFAYPMIDPVYALPTYVVQKLGLRGQVIPSDHKDDLLTHAIYDRLQFYYTL